MPVQFQYKLVYFAIRGLGEPIRLLFADNKINFIDEKIPMDKWPGNLKEKMLFHQLPTLYDGENQWFQHGAIMRHLARKHNLYGDNEDDATHADMVYEALRDTHRKYVQLIYREYEEKKEEFIQQTLPAELAIIEKVLKSKKNGEAYVCGDKITYVDYVLWEFLSVFLTLHSNALDNFSTLKAYHERVKARPHLAHYLSTDARKSMPVNGNGKQ